MFKGVKTLKQCHTSNIDPNSNDTIKLWLFSFFSNEKIKMFSVLSPIADFQSHFFHSGYLLL